MARKGLGKGLDSLIPNIYDENFDSNSPQSLEDILNEKEDNLEELLEEEDKPVEKEEKISEEEVDENDQESSQSTEGSDEAPVQEQEDEVDNGESEDLSGDKDSEESLPASQEFEVKQEHVDEVRAIVDKNPRITLWSSRSAAVFRYLRKTEPEFSISKEASVLIDEAVSKKYPEIWALFDDY